MFKKLMSKTNELSLKGYIKTKSALSDQRGEIPYWVNVGIVILIAIAIGTAIWGFASDKLIGELEDKIMGLWNSITGAKTVN